MGKVLIVKQIFQIIRCHIKEILLCYETDRQLTNNTYSITLKHL